MSYHPGKSDLQNSKIEVSQLPITESVNLPRKSMTSQAQITASENSNSLPKKYDIPPLREFLEWEHVIALFSTLAPLVVGEVFGLWDYYSIGNPTLLHIFTPVLGTIVATIIASKIGVTIIAGMSVFSTQQRTSTSTTHPADVEPSQLLDTPLRWLPLAIILITTIAIFLMGSKIVSK